MISCMGLYPTPAREKPVPLCFGWPRDGGSAYCMDSCTCSELLPYTKDRSWFINELILFRVFNRDKDAVISCGAVLWWFLSQPRVWLFTATCIASPIAHYVCPVLSIVTHVVDMATYAILSSIFCVESIAKMTLLLPYLTLRLALTWLDHARCRRE